MQIDIKKIIQHIFGFIPIFAAIFGFVALKIYADIGVSDTPNKVYMTFALSLWLIFSISGTVFAIIDLIKKNQKKTLPIIGLVANLFVLLLPFIFYALLWLHQLSETSG